LIFCFSLISLSYLMGLFLVNFFLIFINLVFDSSRWFKFYVLIYFRFMGALLYNKDAIVA